MLMWRNKTAYVEKQNGLCVPLINAHHILQNTGTFPLHSKIPLCADSTVHTSLVSYRVTKVCISDEEQHSGIVLL